MKVECASPEMTSDVRTRQDWHAEFASGQMQESFIEFTFEAAHQTPPHSSLHGHSFRVTVYLRGPSDPVFGWSHNLTDIEEQIGRFKKRVDHQYLNDIAGLEVPSLENLTRWIWHQLDAQIEGVDRVMVRRGLDGQTEGCVYGRAHGRI